MLQEHIRLCFLGGVSQMKTWQSTFADDSLQVREVAAACSSRQ